MIPSINTMRSNREIWNNIKLGRNYNILEPELNSRHYWFTHLVKYFVKGSSWLAWLPNTVPPISFFSLVQAEAGEGDIEFSHNILNDMVIACHIQWRVQADYKRKKKRSDSVLWKSLYTHRKIQKASRQHKKRHQNIDYTTIADRLRKDGQLE